MTLKIVAKALAKVLAIPSCAIVTGQLPVSCLLNRLAFLGENETLTQRIGTDHMMARCVRGVAIVPFRSDQRSYIVASLWPKVE